MEMTKATTLQESMLGFEPFLAEFDRLRRGLLGGSDAR
jgi:hypothetical protein